jgi:hypothetical protein
MSGDLLMLAIRDIERGLSPTVKLLSSAGLMPTGWFILRLVLKLILVAAVA